MTGRVTADQLQEAFARHGECLHRWGIVDLDDGRLTLEGGTGSPHWLYWIERGETSLGPAPVGDSFLGVGRKDARDELVSRTRLIEDVMRRVGAKQVES